MAFSSESAQHKNQIHAALPGLPQDSIWNMLFCSYVIFLGTGFDLEYAVLLLCYIPISKAADLRLNRRPVREKGVCSDSNRTATPVIRWRRAKAWKLCQKYVWHDSIEPKFTAKFVANKMQCLKAIV